MERNISQIYNHPGSFIRGKNDLFYYTDIEDTELIISAARGDYERLKTLLESGCNINQQNSRGISAITAASKMGSLECVKILLDNNADANIQTVDGNTPLILTCWYCCWTPAIALTVIRMLIAAGAHLDTKNCHGISALYYAAKSGMPQIVRELLSAGANVNIEDDMNGQTPIMLSAIRAGIKTLNVLLEFDPNVNHKDFNDDTALTLAVMVDNDEVLQFLRPSAVQVVKFVRKLLDNGIDINASNKKHETALFHLSRADTTHYTVTILRMLLRAGVEMNRHKHHNNPYINLNCINACYNTNHLRHDTDDYFSFLRLLFIGGESCDVAHENEVTKALSTTNAQVISNGSLFDLCRAEIRSILVQRQRKNLFQAVPMLPLPGCIIRYLLYGNEL